MTVLVTGSAGLIGSRLLRRLKDAGIAAAGLDVRASEPGEIGDIRDHEAIRRRVAGADGIVHLAALSRVVDAQMNPALCQATNVDATRNLLEAAAESPRKPWFVYASSREIYGEQQALPVHEDTAYAPLNVYARSKVEAERLCLAAREAGLNTSIVRFSTVYGSAADHATRVVPAFLAAGVKGGLLRVEGADCAFDLTHVDDVSAGLVSLIGLLQGGERGLPPIHFVSGVGTTLIYLAHSAIEFGGGRAGIVHAPPRNYDVSRFIGDPSRAAELLGWRATTPLATGLARLAADFAALG